jgi:hypothetical protein
MSHGFLLMTKDITVPETSSTAEINLLHPTSVNSGSEEQHAPLAQVAQEERRCAKGKTGS